MCIWLYLWIRQSCQRFFLLWNRAMWNPLSRIHPAMWKQQRLNPTPDSPAVWKQRRSDEFENRAVWTRHNRDFKIKAQTLILSLHVLMSTYSFNYSDYSISVLKKWPNIKVDIWIKWCLVNIKQGLDRAVMFKNNHQAVGAPCRPLL